MNPEPRAVPLLCLLGVPFCSLSIKSLNKSSNGDPGGSCGFSPCLFGTVELVVIFTTDGLNFSTRLLKLYGASFPKVALLKVKNKKKQAARIT
jgi:hypothetical protein